MRIEIITVTPEIAAQFLLNNKSNRAMRRTHVARLADDIREGRWQLTHQGIAVSADGELLDGQHRLQAIIEAGVPVPMAVATGIAADSAMGLMVDVGAVRSAADLIGAPRPIVDPCSFLQYLHDGRTASKGRVLEFYRAFGDDVRAIRLTSHPARGVTAAPFLAAGVLQALLYGHSYIAASIDRMVRLDFDAMNDAEKAYIRAIHQNRIVTSHKLDTFGKGLAVLDPRMSGSGKIYASERRIDAAKALLRTTFADRAASRIGMAAE